MSAFNLNDNVTLLALADAGRRTTTFTGTGVDVRDFIGKGAVVLQADGVSGASPTLNGKLMDSPDNSTDWQDVTGATFAQVTVAGGELNAKIGVDFNAVRRYLRFVGTIGGTSTPTFDFAVSLLGRKQIV